MPEVYIIIILASTHALEVKNQIKPFQKNSLKVCIPVTEHLLSMLMHIDTTRPSYMTL